MLCGRDGGLAAEGFSPTAPRLVSWRRPHPQVPCNKWRSRQGPRCAGNCPGNAPLTRLAMHHTSRAASYSASSSRRHAADPRCSDGDPGCAAPPNRRSRRAEIGDPAHAIFHVRGRVYIGAGTRRRRQNLGNGPRQPRDGVRVRVRVPWVGRVRVRVRVRPHRRARLLWAD